MNKKVWKKKKKSLISLKLNKNNNFKKAIYFFKVYKKHVMYPFIWHSMWNNLHLHYQTLITFQLVKKFLIKDGLFVNKIYINAHHDGINVLTNSLGVFNAHKAKRKVKKYNEKIKNKKPLSKLAKLILQINKVTFVKLSFYHMYLPKKLVQKNAIKVFKKHKREGFFWQSLQLVYCVFKGYASANILANFIYTHTRRNPKRMRFLAYIRRLLDWHFRSIKNLQVQGVRLEVKGRFNAKSRAKKQIISAGRVRIHEKSSNVDFVYTCPITKFGCLSIKIWICPL